MRRLLLEVAPLRAGRERDRHAVRVQVAHELEGPGEGTDGRPPFVLETSPGGQKVVDAERGWEVWEERDEMCGGFAFRFRCQ